MSLEYVSNVVCPRYVVASPGRLPCGTWVWSSPTPPRNACNISAYSARFLPFPLSHSRSLRFAATVSSPAPGKFTPK